MENLNADKKVLVTGASGGIGRAIAVEAAKAGYYVICHYNGSQGKAEETLSQIKAAGGDGELIQFDVSNREDCKTKLADLSAKHGVLWGIVNNAGVTRDNTFVAMSGDDWDKVIHTNLDSFYNVINPLLMPMASRKNKRGGRIITISSGLPARPIGIVCMIISYTSGRIALVISVSITPGAIALQVIPRPASSTARAFVAPMIPALEAE